jgi:hypothetical protein
MADTLAFPHGTNLRKNHRSITTVCAVGLTYRGYMNALPVDLRDKMKPSMKAVLNRYESLCKWMGLVGPFVMNKNEIRVLWFIINRTVLYGKLAERILIDHARNGVFDSATEECVTPRFGGNNRDWYGAVNSLAAKGFIIIHRVSNNRKKLGTLYEIAIDFILKTQQPETSMSALRQPRKPHVPKSVKKTAKVIDFGAALLERQGYLLDETGNLLPDTCDFSAQNFNLDGATVVHEAGTSSHCQFGTREQKQIQVSQKREQRTELLEVPSSVDNSGRTQNRVRRTPRPAVTKAIDCNVAIRQTIDIAAALSADRRAATVATARIGAAASCGEINAVWKQVMIDTGHLGTVAGLTGRDYGILKSTCRPHVIKFTWYDFFYYVVSQWGAINAVAKSNAEYARKELGDYTRDPNAIYLGSDTPQIGRVVHNFNKLLRIYTDKTGVTAKAQTITDEELDLKRGLEAAQVQLEALRRANEDLARRLVAAAEAKPARPEYVFIKPVIDPTKDTEFQEEDHEIPDWR